MPLLDEQEDLRPPFLARRLHLAAHLPLNPSQKKPPDVSCPRLVESSASPANPKAYAAFLAALQEATDIINKDKRAAVELYIHVTKDKSPVEEILKIMNDPGNEYSLIPKGNMPMVEFMYKIGSIKVKPESWKDLFFPNGCVCPQRPSSYPRQVGVIGPRISLDRGRE